MVNGLRFRVAFLANTISYRTMSGNAKCLHFAALENRFNKLLQKIWIRMSWRVYQMLHEKSEKKEIFKRKLPHAVAPGALCISIWIRDFHSATVAHPMGWNRRFRWTPHWMYLKHNENRKIRIKENKNKSSVRLSLPPSLLTSKPLDFVVGVNKN